MARHSPTRRLAELVLALAAFLPVARAQDSAETSPPTNSAANPEAADSLDQTRPLPPLIDPDTLQQTQESQDALLAEAGVSPILRTGFDAPWGYTGPSGVLPEFLRENSHFVPVEDRWRIGFSPWDRYGKGHPRVDDYPGVVGHWWDPFNQNVLKGDYPIIGQHTFLNIALSSLQIAEIRQIPAATTPFESTAHPDSEDFFRNPNQFFYTNYLKFQASLSHGDAAFKPLDWQLRVGPVFNVNHLDVEELAIVNPDVRKGTTRSRTWGALEEWFIETKIADISAEYDFVSLRAGSQFFNSDFRGFIFADTNRSIRLFGTNRANRHQFNFIFFDQTDKEINSGLNTFDDRHQNTWIANYYIQDLIWPGYTAQWSVHYNNDQPSFKFNKNNFLARPDPTGVFTPHEVDAVYFGWTGNGHIDRYNITHAFYWAVGEDSLNPLAGRPQDINAQMAAVELSYDRDWIRFRSSLFWSSGDDNINDDRATGFDTIFDNPAFAGGGFSYWQRQAIPLLGVNLVQAGSLVPDLRSSKFQGQSNFVNPGLFLVNFGFDFDVTPKFRVIQNNNVLWFDENDVLEQFLFQDNIGRHIGWDLSLGFEYRPLLSNNIILVAGVATLLPGDGFEDIYDPITGDTKPLGMGFIELALAY